MMLPCGLEKTTMNSVREASKLYYVTRSLMVVMREEKGFESYDLRRGNIVQYRCMVDDQLRPSSNTNASYAEVQILSGSKVMSIAYVPKELYGYHMQQVAMATVLKTIEVEGLVINGTKAGSTQVIKFEKSKSVLLIDVSPAKVVLALVSERTPHVAYTYTDFKDLSQVPLMVHL